MVSVWMLAWPLLWTRMVNMLSSPWLVRKEYNGAVVKSRARSLFLTIAEARSVRDLLLVDFHGCNEVVERNAKNRGDALSLSLCDPTAVLRAQIFNSPPWKVIA